MKKILVLIFLFAFVADSVDADEFLAQVPLLHVAYIGQSTTDGLKTSDAGDIHNGDCSPETVFSSKQEKSRPDIIQRVDEDSPSLQVSIYPAQQITEDSSQELVIHFVAFSLAHTPDIYLLSRLNI